MSSLTNTHNKLLRQLQQSHLVDKCLADPQSLTIFEEVLVPFWLDIMQEDFDKSNSAFCELSNGGVKLFLTAKNIYLEFLFLKGDNENQTDLQNMGCQSIIKMTGICNSAMVDFFTVLQGLFIQDEINGLKYSKAAHKGNSFKKYLSSLRQWAIECLNIINQMSLVCKGLEIEEIGLKDLTIESWMYLNNSSDMQAVADSIKFKAVMHGAKSKYTVSTDKLDYSIFAEESRYYLTGELPWSRSYKFLVKTSDGVNIAQTNNVRQDYACYEDVKPEGLLKLVQGIKDTVNP